MNKSSAPRDSAVSQAKESVHFSQFGSVKSDHSDLASVKSKKVDEPDQLEAFGNKSSNQRELVVSQGGASANFSMFGSVKSGQEV